MFLEKKKRLVLAIIAALLKFEYNKDFPFLWMLFEILKLCTWKSLNLPFSVTVNLQLLYFYFHFILTLFLAVPHGL